VLLYRRHATIALALALGFLLPNGKDQRLAALGSAITHDDARETFASGGYIGPRNPQAYRLVDAGTKVHSCE